MFGVSGGDTSPALEVQEGILDQMAKLVQIAVVFTLHPAVLLGRNHHLHPRLLNLADDDIRIVAAVGEQDFRVDSFDQSTSMRAIRCGTLCNKDSDRHTMRIHGQMYLGVEPPFVRLIP